MRGDIRVIDLRLMPGDKTVRGFCDIEIGDWTVRDFRIIRQAGQKILVSYPQVSWKEPTGEIRYRSILTIPVEEKQRIDIAILSAYQLELEKTNGNPT